MRTVLLLAALLVLAGCGDPRPQQTAAWMAAERAKLQPRIDALPAPRSHEAEVFTGEGRLDPFNPQRLGKLAQPAAPSPGQGAPSALMAREMARHKEVLESFPLASMVMVGSLQRGGQPVALVQAGGALHQVRVGHYLGQNYGRVTRITEHDIALREMVPDTAGGWTQRMTRLAMQEGSK